MDCLLEFQMFEVAMPPRVSDNEEGIKEVKKRRV
jgi:hypothetical protein